MTLLTRKRLAILFLGTALGAWLSLRLQFTGFAFWSRASRMSEEATVVGIALLLAALLVCLLFVPLSLLLERWVPPPLLVLVVAASSVISSFAFGIWVYAGFLPRTREIALTQDLSYVSGFSFVGVGYASAYWLQRRLWPASAPFYVQ